MIKTSQNSLPPILVDRRNYILDGSHRATVALLNDTQIKVGKLSIYSWLLKLGLSSNVTKTSFFLKLNHTKLKVGWIQPTNAQVTNSQFTNPISTY